MSLRSSTWPTATHPSEEDCENQVVSTGALDFFLVLASLAREQIWSRGISLGGGRRAGQGAFAFAEICETKSGELVAVKRSLKLHGSLWVYQEQEFAHHFNEFCLELCILTHVSVRSHENIINLRAIFEEDISGVPSLSLVLEYGDYGTLDYFLQNNPAQNEEHLLGCISQLASGFKTLHKLGICHGDIKTKNVLVVSKDSRWVCKICDFGHAVVSSKYGDGEVQLPRGTEIYNAPEVRNLGKSAPNSTTIADALLTDLYSFGLLVWEVLVQGEVYYKTIQTRELGTLDAANIHKFLGKLSQNKMLEYAFCVIEAQNFSTFFKDRFTFVLQGTLRCNPNDRINMEAIERIWDYDGSLRSPSFGPNTGSQILRPSTTRVGQGVEHEESNGDDTILSWSREISLFERFTVAQCHATLQKIFSSSVRKQVQGQMISELKKIAENSTQPRRFRASAALSVSECLTIGWNHVYHTDDVIFWLRYAVTLGSPLASLWCPRVFNALCPNAPWLLNEITECDNGESNQYYLASSIRHNINRKTRWMVVPSDPAQDQLGEPISYGTILESCLSPEASFFFLKALKEDTDSLDSDQEPNLPNSSQVVSTQGFTLVHFACLGGRLSKLRLLLDKGYSATQPTIHGITPLHLCIFFAECDIETAVHLLLECGRTSVTTSVIYWPEYDLTLSGSPLSWAISTRNLKLVKILLPEYIEDRPADIRRAFRNYYWEILEEILRRSPSEENLWNIYLFDFELPPYHHWIAHGSERFSSIDRTLEVVERRNLVPIPESRNMAGTLMAMMNRASTEEHLHHIEWLLERMTASQIKSMEESQHSPLLIAIMAAKMNTIWKRALKILLTNYTVEELQKIRIREPDGVLSVCSILHFTVVQDCVVGARALLEKGVDPNESVGLRGIAPLYTCFAKRCSVEMCDTLLEFGADLSMELLLRKSSQAIGLLLSDRHENTRLIDHIIRKNHSKRAVLEMLIHLIVHRITPGDQRYSLLRHLLGIPEVKKYLNAKFSEGFTILLFSAVHCLPEVTQLLLEAGADPLVPFHFEDEDVYPLQIICAMGFHYGNTLNPRHGSHNRLEWSEKREKLLRIALMLLEWQLTAKDNPFQGITRLHIVSYIGIEQEIQRLLAEGQDPKALGKWPKLPKGISPRRIIEAHVEFTRVNRNEREPTNYKALWRELRGFFHQDTAADIKIFTSLRQESKAVKHVHECVINWVKRWSKRDLLPTPDGFN